MHARAMTLELARYPAYAVPTLALPAVFFLFFAAGMHADATARMATFAGFAALGVAFFQFGVGIASERDTPWETFLRALPLAPLTRIGARLLSAAGFAAAAATVTIGVALATTSASLSAVRWSELAAALLVGIVPFALLGIALGYWVPARAALPVANLLYLGLAYAGGLWFRTGALPARVAAISPYLPTGALAGALLGAARGTAPPRPWLTLAVCALLFGGLAGWGYRRDERRRFG